MITVTVRYNNILRTAAGVVEESFVFPAGLSLRRALAQIGDSHGPRLRELLFEPDGRVVTHLVVFMNRKLVLQEQYGVALAEGDELLLFPAVSGG